MVLRLSHAPKFGATKILGALAFGLIATGIAVSESQTWETVRSPLAPPAEQAGPPMPASMVPTESPEMPVNLADNDAADTTSGPPVTPVEIPEVAQPSLDLEQTPAPVQAAEPNSATDDAMPDVVRMIEMPRRDDELDNLGRPTVAPDEYEVAALPAPTAGPASEENPAETLDEELVAPIPAPAYRRPITSYLVDDDFVEPRRVLVQRDPATTGSVYSYDVHYVEESWPRRLDNVVTVQGQANVVDDITPYNMFQTDWVEVREGGARRVVAQ